MVELLLHGPCKEMTDSSSRGDAAGALVDQRPLLPQLITDHDMRGSQQV
jgi:hypothetical protein